MIVPVWSSLRGNRGNGHHGTSLNAVVLVHFHAAGKDIPKTGQFTKERDLTGFTEASQSWWKARRSKSCLTGMAASKEKELVQGNPTF